MPFLEGSSLWWWVIGIGVVAVLLVRLGRLAGRASVAGQMPPDMRPDVKADETGMEPDITPADQGQGKPRD